MFAFSGLSGPLPPLGGVSPSFRSVSSRRPVGTVVASSSLHAREIIDSRGNPTVEVDLTTHEGKMFRAAVPSGASTGAYEALEMRDVDDTQRYGGKGVRNAIANINDVIAKAFEATPDIDFTDQRALDQMLIDLDGTQNKAKLGANAILGVSMVGCMAGAHARGVPLYEHIAHLAGRKGPPTIMPVPVMNVINGGSHAGNKLAMQEFMILPTGFDTFAEAMRVGCEVYAALKKVIKKRYGLDATAVGDEGGFAPNIQDNREGLDLINVAIGEAGYSGKVKIGMDVAASEFYKADSGKYDLDFKNPDAGDASVVTHTELIDMYKSFAEEYPVVTIEDPFDQDDWNAFTQLTAAIPSCQVVGDDLTVTNTTRIAEALEKKSANALLLKINQIGTITESIDACNLAMQNGWGVMVSHRSGETEDTFIADLVVGLGTGQIKTGAPCRSERLAKYNQLLRIEEQLGDSAVYAGADFRKPPVTL